MAFERTQSNDVSGAVDSSVWQVDGALLGEVARRSRDIPARGAPLSRIGGQLEIGCAVDLESRRVSDAASVATFFRGYEALLAERGLREAGLVSSTAAGICGGVHTAASSQCLEMALGIRPPPLGIVLKNLLLSCQSLDENPMHLFVFSGPDYSGATVRRTNPEVWARAESARCARAATHGYATVGALMTALDRPAGRLFLEALAMVRVAREAYTVLGGKYPHSESIIPGGVALSLTEAKLDDFQRKLAPFADFAKKCISVWEDVFDFLYEVNPAYAAVGEAPATMVDFGLWDDEEVYDARYERCDEWGERRWMTPGAIVDGELVTTRLSEINAGLEDFVERSHHDLVGDTRFEKDALGNPLSPHHPWNKRLVPRAGSPDPGRYSWATASTWRRRSFEVGAYVRVYASALGRKLPPSGRFASTGRSLVLELPAHALPAARVEWSVPVRWNAFERTRARAYAVAFNLLVLLEGCDRARRLFRAGESRIAAPFDVPEDGEVLGAGFCGASRGFLGHWAIVQNGAFANYRIAMPSRINAGPRTPWGELGPCERAVKNTPILESAFRSSDDFAGIDVVRAVQSFDPCMPCSARLLVREDGRVLERPVTTTGP